MGKSGQRDARKWKRGFGTRQATNTLSTLAAAASSRLSVTSMRIRRMRSAPSESRTAISRRRAREQERSYVGARDQQHEVKGGEKEGHEHEVARGSMQLPFLRPRAVGDRDRAVPARVVAVTTALECTELGFRVGA